MKPIIKKSLAEEVAETLEHSIQSGAIAIDSKLPSEPELMKNFGVGRSSIREAIKILAQSGFVKVQQGLGTFVISHTGNTELNNKIERADFSEVFEVRQILEIKIIEKAAQNRTKVHLDIMHKSLEDRAKFAQEGQLENCMKADINFHTTIAESCGNSILTELYKNLTQHVERFFKKAHKDASPFILSQHLHEELLKNIEDKNSEQAIITAQKIIGKF